MGVTGMELRGAGGAVGPRDLEKRLDTNGCEWARMRKGEFSLLLEAEERRSALAGVSEAGRGFQLQSGALEALKFSRRAQCPRSELPVGLTWRSLRAI